MGNHLAGGKVIVEAGKEARSLDNSRLTLFALYVNTQSLANPVRYRVLYFMIITRSDISIAVIFLSCKFYSDI